MYFLYSHAVKLVSHESERKRIISQRLEGNDVAILQAEKERDFRDYQSVVKDLRQVARNGAPVVFCDWLESRTLSIQQRTDFVGLVVMLARVENDALNRYLL